GGAAGSPQTASLSGTGVDTAPPDTLITAGPSQGAIVASASASFSFSGTDNLTPAGNLTFQCSLDGAAFAACTSPVSYSALAEGSHTFSVRAVDGSNNVDP